MSHFILFVKINWNFFLLIIKQFMIKSAKKECLFQVFLILDCNGIKLLKRGTPTTFIEGADQKSAIHCLKAEKTTHL